MVAVHHPLLFRLEAFAGLPDRLDAAEQRLVQRNRVAVTSEQRRHLALHRLQGIVGISGCEVEEHRRDLVEPEAG